MNNVELRAARAALSITQAQLATKLGVQVRTISRWECGPTKPALPTLVAQALKHLLKEAEGERQ